MDGEKLIWLSGLSLAAGGIGATVGWLLFAILDPPHHGPAKWWWWPGNILVISGGLFMILGLPGFYVTQAEKIGVIGLLGFISFFAGLALAHIGVHAVETTTMPAIPAGMKKLVSIAEPSLFVGVLLTTIAIQQAGVYPSWLAAAFLLSILLGMAKKFLRVPLLLGQNLFSMIFTITMTGAGILMMSIF